LPATALRSLRAIVSTSGISGIWGQFGEAGGSASMKEKTEETALPNPGLLQPGGACNRHLANDPGLTGRLTGQEARMVGGYTGAEIGTVALGTYSGVASNSFDGYIAEVVAYNRALTTAEQVWVERYLTDKYNITAGPP
jgi:hypothetical protein